MLLDRDLKTFHPYRFLLAGAPLHPGPHRAAGANHGVGAAPGAPAAEPGDRAPPGDLGPAAADAEPQDRERPRHLLRRARVRGRPDADGRGALRPVAPPQGPRARQRQGDRRGQAAHALHAAALHGAARAEQGGIILSSWSDFEPLLDDILFPF